MNTSTESIGKSKKSHLKSIFMLLAFLTSNQIVNASYDMSNVARDQKHPNRLEVVGVEDARLNGSCLALIKQSQCHFDGSVLQKISGQCSTQLYFKGTSQPGESAGIYAVVVKSADEVWFETYGALTGISMVATVGLAESARVKMAQSALQDRLTADIKNQKNSIIDHLNLRGVYACGNIQERSDLPPTIVDKITYWE